MGIIRGSRGPKGNRGPRGPKGIRIIKARVAPQTNLLDNPVDIHNTPTSSLGIGSTLNEKPEPL